MLAFEADDFLHMLFLGIGLLEEVAVLANAQIQSGFCFTVMNSDWPWQALLKSSVVWIN